MSTPQDPTPQDPAPSESDLLLPWRITGTLSPAEQARFEAQADDPADLARRLALAEAERAEVLALNDTIEVPSGRVAARLFAAIDAQPRQRRKLDLFSGLGTRLAALSPRTLSWSAAAAALVICVQAASLAFLVKAPSPGASFKTASTSTAPATAVTYVLVGLAPEATVAQIEALLGTSANIVDGPKPGGVFRLRLGTGTLSATERDALLAKLRGGTAIVRFAVPEP